MLPVVSPPAEVAVTSGKLAEEAQLFVERKLVSVEIALRKINYFELFLCCLGDSSLVSSSIARTNRKQSPCLLDATARKLSFNKNRKFITTFANHFKVKPKQLDDLKLFITVWEVAREPWRTVKVKMFPQIIFAGEQLSAKLARRVARRVLFGVFLENADGEED